MCNLILKETWDDMVRVLAIDKVGVAPVKHASAAAAASSSYANLSGSKRVPKGSCSKSQISFKPNPCQEVDIFKYVEYNCCQYLHGLSRTMMQLHVKASPLIVCCSNEHGKSVT